MRLLLDTHVLIWWWTDRTRLSSPVRALLDDGGTEAFASAASAWELATKVRLGKMPNMARHLSAFDTLIADSAFIPLPIRHRHGLHAGGYDLPHGDPFDRVLAAQAELEALTLVTVDPAFEAFPCSTLW